MSLPAFADFATEHQTEVKKVQALLEEKLSDLPGMAEEQGRQAEAWIGRMATLEAFAQSYIEIKGREILQRYEQNAKVGIVEKHIEFETVDETRFHGVVKGLVDALKIRVSFVQSLIKSENQARSRLAT